MKKIATKIKLDIDDDYINHITTRLKEAERIDTIMYDENRNVMGKVEFSTTRRNVIGIRSIITGAIICAIIGLLINLTSGCCGG